MEEHAIKYTQTYQQFKAELDHELNKAATGFVRIGYLLKQARDTDILKDSPYESVTEFAEKEYGLEKSQVSRFMSIHDRFSDPNEPEKLRDNYEGFGVKKLTMMLALPDAQNEELTPEYTAAEIQTLKEAADEEKKITPLEVMTEEKQSGTEDLGDLETILYLIGQDNPEVMADLLHEEGFTLEPSSRKEMAILAPAGQKIYVVRPAGKGRINFNVKPQGASAVSVRDNTKTEYSPDDIGDALSNLVDKAANIAAEMDEYSEDGIPDAKTMWALLYGSSFPTKEEKKIAPVQPKKESKVSAAKKEKPKAEPKPEPEPEEEPEQIMPEPIEEVEAEEIKPKMDVNTLKGYKAGLTADIRTLDSLNKSRNYRAIKTKLESMLNTVKRIIDEEG